MDAVENRHWSRRRSAAGAIRRPACRPKNAGFPALALVSRALAPPYGISSPNSAVMLVAVLMRQGLSGVNVANAAAYPHSREARRLVWHGLPAPVCAAVALY